MKNQNPLRLAFVAIFFSLSFARAADAQLRCTDIFARADVPVPAAGYNVRVNNGGSAMLPPAVASAIAEFRGAIINMRTAKTQKEFNDHQYSVVLTGNHLLDIIVQNSLRSRHPQIAPTQANAINQVSVVLARQLMTAFELPPEILYQVIILRVEALAAELNALSKAAQERRPIGFIAPRAESSATNLNLETLVATVRQMFEASTASSAEKKTIGFTNQRSRSAAEQEPATPKEQIGFIRSPKTNTDTEPVERSPMGFVRSSREKEDSLEMKYQIILNVDSGLFDRLRME
ncbi:MAG: hypothetical protein K2Q26_07280 [Bdellovibrionales bacterium]|nr:hypothetical protein [Bdellovibrionales bacterium]